MLNKIAKSVRDYQAYGQAFLLASFRQRYGSGLLKVNMPSGECFVRRGESDFETLRQVFVHREYDLRSDWHEQQIKARKAAISKAGGTPVIVDAGANIGAASMWFGDRYPDCHIIAIEPDPHNADILRKNVEGRSNVTVVQAAIGGERGHVTVQRSDKGWAVQTERGNGSCPIVTMADAVAMVSNGTLLIAKIDIEGFEGDLFASNTEWLEDAASVMIEPHDWMLPGKSTSLAFRRALAAYPFEMLIRGENLIFVRPCSS